MVKLLKFPLASTKKLLELFDESMEITINFYYREAVKFFMCTWKRYENFPHAPWTSCGNISCTYRNWGNFLVREESICKNSSLHKQFYFHLQHSFTVKC
jgi:hypothetical protein